MEEAIKSYSRHLERVPRRSFNPIIVEEAIKSDGNASTENDVEVSILSLWKRPLKVFFEHARNCRNWVSILSLWKRPLKVFSKSYLLEVQAVSILSLWKRPLKELEDFFNKLKE